MEPARFFPHILVLALVVTACSQEKNENKANPTPAPVLVSVANVIQKSVPLTIQTMGNAETCHAVTIKSRVDGEIVKTHIQDGQELAQGAPLFDLDDRPFQYRLRQLKANLERDLAVLENARAKEQRQVVLNKQKIASEETLTALVASRQAAEANVAADRAAIAEGELQLGFSRITAPISGMAGSILVQSGNLVKANDTALVLLQQMDPICLTFTVAETHLTAIRTNHSQTPLTVTVFPNRETSAPIAATLYALDNSVDRQTGTIRLKAKAPNKDRRLWPGLFVTLSIQLSERPHALVIPTRALQTGSKGSFVYRVKSDDSVENSPVTIASEEQNETVITSGLNPGDRVVTVGQWRLKPGAKVELSAKDDPNPDKK
ncbi:MAG: efflux RND transporter periplasmic adaptor subunit [Magnetococcales bacterium]|nr:efflux RND transporter periplasmic adaptor subunit [Magnetococcales bacterium]NGZ04874.1 efflux RND transporter periplasmic adaptor subunit [Magnetococcales bacterium]